MSTGIASALAKADRHAGLDAILLHGLVTEVVDEVRRAHAKHGAESMVSPGHDPGKRLAILVEEVGEVASALTYDKGDPDNLREELIQVAAMALSWVYADVIEAGAAEPLKNN